MDKFYTFTYDQQSSDGYKATGLEVTFARPVTLEHATAYLEQRAALGKSTVTWVSPVDTTMKTFKAIAGHVNRDFPSLFRPEGGGF